jgi:hypothetical protein
MYVTKALAFYPMKNYENCHWNLSPVIMGHSLWLDKKESCVTLEKEQNWIMVWLSVENYRWTFITLSNGLFSNFRRKNCYILFIIPNYQCEILINALTGLLQNNGIGRSIIFQLLLPISGRWYHLSVAVNW